VLIIFTRFCEVGAKSVNCERLAVARRVHGLREALWCFSTSLRSGHSA